MKKIFIVIVALIMSGCGNKSLNSAIELRPEPLKDSASETCPIYDSRNWHAWIDRPTQKATHYRLNIVGVVDLPSPSYEVSWVMGIMDRANPPTQRLTISARAKGEGAAIQVITPTRIEIKQESPLPAYREIVIFCGNRLLTNIYDVGLTD